MWLKSGINKLLWDPKKSKKLSQTKEYFWYWVGDILDWKKEEYTNEYGLKIDYIQSCLDMIFSWSLTDGWFIYAWFNTQDNGSHRFDLVEKSPLYEKNITHKERVLYYDKEFINTMWPYFMKSKVKNIIELWPWSWEKFPEYRHKWIKEYDEFRPINTPHIHKNQKKYYALDISAQSIENTSKNYWSRDMELLSWVIGDFFEWWELPWKLENQWFVFLWWSIGNFPIRKIKELLKHMQSNQRWYSTPALISYFSAPEKNKLTPEEYQNKILELKATYGDPDTNNPYYDQETHRAINDFIMGGFQALWLPIDKLELVVEYDESPMPWTPAKIEVGVKILEDFSVKIGHRSYHGSKWHTLRAIQSQRFSLQDWKEILDKSWWIVKENFDNDGVWALLIKSKIGYHNKFKTEKHSLVSMALLSLLTASTVMGRNMISEKSTREKLERISLNDLRDKKITVSTYNNYDELDLQQREEWMNKTSLNVYHSIDIRYWSWSFGQDDMIEFIKDDLSQQENLSIFGYSGYYKVDVIEYADMFVSKHKRYLEKMWINTTPYANKFKVPDVKFKNVINCTWKEKSFNEFKIILRWWFGWTTDVSWYKSALGRYQTRFWDIYDLWTFNNISGIPPSMDMWDPIREQKSNYIYAAPFNENTEDSRDTQYEYTIDYAKIVAYDYFEQSRPVTREIINQFYKMFMWAPSTHYVESKSREYYKYNDRDYGYEFEIWNTIRELIIKDLVNTGMIYKIEAWDYFWILDYIVWFHAKYKNIFPSKWVSFMRPYEKFYHHFQAFSNTVSSWEKLGMSTISHQERKKYNFQYLGSYTTLDWKDYDVGVVEINDKPYIAVRDKNKRDIFYEDKEKIYENDYYIGYEWLLVAKEYLKLQRKFWFVAKYLPPAEEFTNWENGFRF